MKELKTVDATHERFGIIAIVTRFVSAERMRDLAELLRPTRDLGFEKSVLIKILAYARNVAIDIKRFGCFAIRKPNPGVFARRN